MNDTSQLASATLALRVRGRDAGDGTAVYRKQIDEDRGGSNYPNSSLVHGVLLGGNGSSNRGALFRRSR